MPIPGDEWDFVTVDRITHLPETDKGHTGISLAMDKLTNMVHFAPCRDDDNAEHIAELFAENVYKLHGSPFEVLTDRGTEFCNKFADGVLKVVGTLHHRTTAYHHQSNGRTERMNRVLKDMLRQYVNSRQTKRDTTLPVLEFAVNNTWQESTGNTPFLLNYGRHLRTPAVLVLSSENPALSSLSPAVRKPWLRPSQPWKLHSGDTRPMQMGTCVMYSSMWATRCCSVRKISLSRELAPRN